jgi:DNA replicative helicase MCM subunit Mcm2 (Cdc46/Mcm family)
MQTLRKYFCWVAALQPVLLPEAEALLTAFYQAQRRAAGRTKALTTIRMLEGLVRIAQARSNHRAAHQGSV